MKKQFFPALDIMRGILAIAVVYGHTGFMYPVDLTFIGSYAVMFFFSISGFLLAHLATKEYESTQNFNVRSFYYRRILRIWPSYFLYVIIVCGLMYVMHETMTEDLLLSLVFLGNLKNSLYPIFISTHTDHYYWGILWSLGVEEQFYLFFPMFIVLLIKSNPKRNIIRWAVLLVVCTLIRYAFLWYGTMKNYPVWPGICFQSTSYIDMIFFSILLGIYRDRLRDSFATRRAVDVSALAITIWFSLTMQFFFHACSYKPGLSYWYPITGIVSAVAVLVFSFIRYSNPGRITKAAIYLGKLSYGIYLFHMPIYLGLSIFRVIKRDSPVAFPVVLLSTILFSHLVYKYYERIFRSTSRKKYAILKQ